jgi:DedD protein
MGLFSKLRKNKQDSAGEDSGYYNADDQSATAKARSKRASNAGGAPRRGGKEAPDPVLPEKKRARRRLVGAVALALAVAIGLPMLLDSAPKPLANDIAIRIPAKDKPAAEQAAAPAPSSRVAAGDALDQSEEIVNEPPPKAPAAAAPVVAEVKTHTEPKPAKPEAPKPEARPKPEAKPESRHDAKPEAKPHEARIAEARPEPKPEPKAEPKPARPAEPKPAAKPAPSIQSAEDARALAILEGKPAAKPQEAGSGKFIVQVAALATQDKVDELQGKLRDAGISSHTQKVSTPAGERIRVRMGPFGSKEEAEKARAKLSRLGLGGSLVPV